jgi:ankyrin repeat protein
MHELVVAHQAMLRYVSKMHDAAREGDIGKVEHLILVSEVDPKAVDRDGATALHWAAAEGQVKTMEWLHKQGVSATSVDHNGR